MSTQTTEPTRLLSRTSPGSAARCTFPTLHPSLHQSHCITLIYSSKPKISRCYHSDILHFIKSGVGEHFLLKLAAHSAQQQAFVPLLIRFRQLRVNGCEAVLDRASRANPAECAPSLTGLSSRIVRHLHRCRFLFPSAEETWQLPPRSTRPVSPSSVCYCAGSGRCVNVDVEAGKNPEAAFVGSVAEEGWSPARPPQPGSSIIPFPHSTAPLFFMALRPSGAATCWLPLGLVFVCLVFRWS